MTRRNPPSTGAIRAAILRSSARGPVLLLLIALAAMSCKPKPPPSKVTFANVCDVKFDPVRGIAQDVVLEGYLSLPRVGTACSSTCMITISAAPGDAVHRLNAFVKTGGGPNTMDALGATYTLADLKVRDARGNLLDSRKKVRLTGWRAGLGGLGCGINPDIIEPAE